MASFSWRVPASRHDVLLFFANKIDTPGFYNSAQEVFCFFTPENIINATGWLYILCKFCHQSAELLTFRGYTQLGQIATGRLGQWCRSADPRYRLTREHPERLQRTQQTPLSWQPHDWLVWGGSYSQSVKIIIYVGLQMEKEKRDSERESAERRERGT